MEESGKKSFFEKTYSTSPHLKMEAIEKCNYFYKRLILNAYRFFLLGKTPLFWGSE
jgi:hypothetical protein